MYSSPGRPVDTGRWECDSAMRHRAGGGLADRGPPMQATDRESVHHLHSYRIVAICYALGAIA